MSVRFMNKSFFLNRALMEYAPQQYNEEKSSIMSSFVNSFAKLCVKTLRFPILYSKTEPVVVTA